MGALGAGALGGAGIAIVISAVDRFSGVFAKVNKNMLGLGAALTGVGIAGAVVMGGLIKQTISFESAFIGVRKTVDLTEAEFKDLEGRFKSMAKTIPLTFQELAGIGEIAGQLGVTGVDNIATFTRTIADISATTNLTAEQAATDFARFANIMNMPISKVDKLGSVVVDLGNNLATTEAEIVEMSMRISGAGRALDMTEGQVMAWGAALTSVGVRAEMGGTAISKLMINISSMVATGSEDLKGFAEVAGMTTEEFSKAFKEDASNALQTFFQGLGKIKEGGGDVLTVLENLDIKEVRLRDTVLRLSSSYGTLDEALAIQGEAWNENTALTVEAEKRYASMESQLKILKNQFSILGAEMGEVLVPILEKVIGGITKMVDWFSNLTDGQKKWIVVSGLVITGLSLLAGVVILLSVAFGALMAVTAPVWIAIGIGIAVIAAIVAAIMYWDEVVMALGDTWSWLKDKILMPVWNTMKSIAAWIKNTFLSIIGSVVDRIKSVINLAGKAGGFISSAVGRVLGSKQMGGYIPQTGLYQLHKGEYVLPKVIPTGGKGQVINVNINNLNGFNARDIANKLMGELNKKITL